VTHKLLLADDSVTIQRVVELTFSGEDVQVVTVGDGEQAITRIPVELPDIVLADIGMPKRSGYDVAAFVKGRSDLSHIPVLLLAGAFEPIDENRAKQVRSDGVLVKPFEPQQVIARVKNLIESSRNASGRTITIGASVDQPARNGDAVVPMPRPVAAIPEPTASVLQSGERTGESKLDDYFDRLDAAFAELGTDAERDRRTSDLRDDFDGRDVPTLESLLAVSGGTAPEELPMPEPPMPVELAEYEPPVQPSARGSGSAAQESPQSKEGRNLVADMFAALFAAEQGDGVVPQATYQAQRAPAGPAPVVTDSLVDEVTRRVVERLAPEAANELVAQIVSEVAERLIREEISRIKAAAATRL
jgi:DNA-binding response OmpR family regulator